MRASATTNEGAACYDHSMNHSLEFFSKAGSLFIKKGAFYGNEATALGLFKNSWFADNEISMRLLFWLRDCRGGAGNRSGFRSCLTWLADADPRWILKNIYLVPECGRWDDLRSLFGTTLELDASIFWAAAIKSGNTLAAKWADRKDYPIRKVFGMKIGEFRRYLADCRKNSIVENNMCKKEWREITYSHVPSVAMARYTNAFGRNDEKRFEAYKEGLTCKTEKVNASVLFPHDCVRTARSGDAVIADAQFDVLPNYMEGVDERVIALCDTSESMQCIVSGSVQAIDISKGLALYCSEKIGEDNPFYRKFIAFESESKFVDWEGMKFSDTLHDHRIFNGACGMTRIDKALDLILDSAKMWNVENNKMPTSLLIASDMQFTQGVTAGHRYGWSDENGVNTVIEKALMRWDEAGYKRPKIIYWNLAGYSGSPATNQHQDVALVSGFSPSILKAVFDGTDLTPEGVMMRAIEKYDIVRP